MGRTICVSMTQFLVSRTLYAEVWFCWFCECHVISKPVAKGHAIVTLYGRYGVTFRDIERRMRYFGFVNIESHVISKLATGSVLGHRSRRTLKVRPRFLQVVNCVSCICNVVRVFENFCYAGNPFGVKFNGFGVLTLPGGFKSSTGSKKALPAQEPRLLRHH